MESATSDVKRLSMPPNTARISEDFNIDGIISVGNERVRGWGSWLGICPKVGTSAKQQKWAFQLRKALFNALQHHTWTFKGAMFLPLKKDWFSDLKCNMHTTVAHILHIWPDASAAILVGVFSMIEVFSSRLKLCYQQNFSQKDTWQ